MSAKKTVWILMLVTLISALCHIIPIVSEFGNEYFWTTVAVTGYYYCPVLLLEITALIGLHLWEKRKKKVE